MDLPDTRVRPQGEISPVRDGSGYPLRQFRLLGRGKGPGQARARPLQPQDRAQGGGDEGYQVALLRFLLRRRRVLAALRQVRVRFAEGPLRSAGKVQESLREMRAEALMTMKLPSVVAAFVLSVLSLNPVPASAQSWPQRPVKFVVPLGPGSGADITARLLGDRLAKLWGQPVVIENRPGG